MSDLRPLHNILKDLRDIDKTIELAQAKRASLVQELQQLETAVTSSLKELASEV